MSQKLIFELSSKGREGSDLPELDLPIKNLEELIPKDYLREKDIELPEVSQVDVVRHFIALSILNHHVDNSVFLFYQDNYFHLTIFHHMLSENKG